MTLTTRLVALASLTSLIGVMGCAAGHTTLPARQLNAGEFAVSGNLEVTTPNLSIQGLYGTGSADFGLGIGTTFATFNMSAFGRGYLGEDFILGGEVLYSQGFFGGVPLFTIGDDIGSSGADFPFSTVKFNPRFTGALKPGQFLYAGLQAEFTGSIYNGSNTDREGLHFNGVQAGGLVGADIFNPTSGVGIQIELKLLPVSAWSYNTADPIRFGVFPFQSGNSIGPSALEVTTSVYLRTNNEAAPPPPSIEDDVPPPTPKDETDGGGSIPSDIPPPPPIR